MKRALLKELRYGLRNSRFLILFISFFFFALMTPVMTKVVLPMILQSQFPGLGEDALAGMLDLSQRGSLQSYMGDIFEVGSLIVAITLCSLLAQELRDNTLVLPLCSGLRFSHIILAKMIVFGSVLIVLPVAALTASYIYAGLLFSFEIPLWPVLLGGLLQGLFMLFLLACLLLTGALTRKPIVSGITSLVGIYGLYAFGSLLNWHNYLPTGLLVEAQELADRPSASLIWPIMITLAVISLFTLLSIIRLHRLEWQMKTV